MLTNVPMRLRIPKYRPRMADGTIADIQVTQPGPAMFMAMLETR